MQFALCRPLVVRGLDASRAVHSNSELELRALGERFSRLGDERADDRACRFDVSDEACALTADGPPAPYRRICGVME